MAVMTINFLTDITSLFLAECDGANDKVKSHLVSLTQLQQSAKDSEIELDSCQAQASQCQTTLTGMQGEM